MPRHRHWIKPAAGGLLCVLMLAAPSTAQEARPDMTLRAGLGVEFLNRTISWDEEASTSRLGGWLFTLQAELEVRRGLTVGLRAGYALSDFEGLVFRELPFSLEYQAGPRGGLTLGGGLKAVLLRAADWDLEVEAVLDACLGFVGEWPIEGLAVEGTSEGRSSWMRVSAGPVLWYKGLPFYVYPFLRVSFTSLWGAFRMSEIVGSLEGTEEKQVRGLGRVAVALGVQSDVSDFLGLRAEVSAVPRDGGLDLGAVGRLILSF